MRDNIAWDDPVIDKQLEFYRKEAALQKVFRNSNELLRYILKYLSLKAAGTEYQVREINKNVKVVKLRYTNDSNVQVIKSLLVTSSLNIRELDYGDPDVLAWCIVNAPLAMKDSSNEEVYNAMLDAYNATFNK